jgi:hypothetical protein
VRTASLRLALVLAVVLAANVSCNVSDYCLNCAVNDGGNGDGGGIDANGDAPDSGPFADACVPTSVEICDNQDNDCDGTTDENPLGVGDVCGDSTPPCTIGVTECVGGVLGCTGVEPVPEICDGIDNNCDGNQDEADPGGGGPCGSNVGECVAGIERCIGGAIQCVGASGMPEDPLPPDEPEALCDGQDNDCDGVIDDGIVLGTCGPPEGSTGECQLGQLQCVGGGTVCVGAEYPTFELCDGLDQDCDGNNTNGFSLMTDPQNCGMCGNVCDVANATAACVNGDCVVGSCDPDFHDVNMDGQSPDPPGTDGCEYGPCEFQSTQEACNGADDDCDQDLDEGVVAPLNFCRQVGACAGSTAVCTGTTGWQCNYGPDVSTDGMGNIVPESTCDDIDNDCDGPVDESHPSKNQPCNDGELGACLDPGIFRCNTLDPGGPTVCDAVDDDVGTPPAEVCNGIDDNCDGTVDNGSGGGMMAGQEFVTIGTVNIMKYEASRPNATAGSQGTGGTYVCSRDNVIPWTNVTRPQAQAACVAIGARLCTEAEWQSACFATTQTFPITGPTGANDRVFIEAEDGVASGAVNGDTWTFDSGTTGYSGLGTMIATPNNNTSFGCTAATQEANAPRIDFTVNVQTTGNYFIWTRMRSAGGSDDSVCVGVDGTASATTIGTSATTYTWVVSPAINVATTGNHRFSVYMREDGTSVDAIAISKNGLEQPTEHRFAWAYATNPSTPQPSTCNADPFDTNTGLAGDQDDILATGSLAACRANGPTTNDAFDMTGNVREWTSPRSPGVNAMRGGASNTEINGTACQDDFVLGSNTFFFPNVGFRCCR